MHAIVSYRCPADFSPTKGALSLNDLRWMPTQGRTNIQTDFDETSQAVLFSQSFRHVFD